MPDKSQAKPAESAGTQGSRRSPQANPKSLLPLVLAALVIAVLAGALAGAAWWFRPASPQSYSDEQIAEAKTKVCGAALLVRQGVVRTTNLGSELPLDAEVLAINARLTLVGGGAYLHDHLAAAPATPADLAKTVQAVADTTAELGMQYLANPGMEQNELLHNLNIQMQQLDEFCQ